MYTAETVTKAILADLDNRSLLNGVDDFVLAEIGDEIEGNVANLADEIERLRAVLESIAKNTCCDRCQEAALVAKAALAELSS